MSDGGSIQAKAITGLYEGETGNGRIGRRPIRLAYRKETDNGCLQRKAVTGL